MHDSEEDSPEPVEKQVGKSVNELPQKSDEQLNAEMVNSVDPDLVPHGEGMTPKRIARIHKAMEFTGKNERTVLATAKAKSFEEISEESYIAVMNLFLKLMTDEQKAEIGKI